MFIQTKGSTFNSFNSLNGINYNIGLSQYFDAALIYEGHCKSGTIT